MQPRHGRVGRPPKAEPTMMEHVLAIGSGYKTAIGIVLWVIGEVIGLIGGVDLGSAIKEVGVIVGGVGLAHKAVKAG